MFKYHSHDYTVNADGSYSLLLPDGSSKLYSNRANLFKTIDKQIEKLEKLQKNIGKEDEEAKPAKKVSKVNGAKPAVTAKKLPKEKKEYKKITTRDQPVNNKGEELLNDYLSHVKAKQTQKHDYVTCTCEKCNAIKQKKIQHFSDDIENSKDMITLIKFMLEKGKSDNVDTTTSLNTI